MPRFLIPIFFCLFAAFALLPPAHTQVPLEYAPPVTTSICRPIRTPLSRVTIVAQSADFGPAALEGAEVRLIFKPYKDALPEHIADRLTHVRDEYANMVEEGVNSRHLNLFNRFDADITDLLRVDPENKLGRAYWHEWNSEQPWPSFILPQAPPGVPEWAYLQVQDLGALKRLINWYIDHRQISNGEFGGGLSDDNDFTELFPGLALMGSTPGKIKASLWREMEAMYAQHMFTNGLATVQTDQLHSYEDGINVLGESMLLDFGSPRQIERAMVTAKRLEWLTGRSSACAFQLLQWHEDGYGPRVGLVKGRVLYCLPSRSFPSALQRLTGNPEDDPSVG